MAKEIRTILWCDGPHGEDEQIEATITRRFAIDKLKERELDLCDVCDKAVVSPLLDLLSTSGQPIARQLASAPTAQATLPTTEIDPSDLLTCPDCGRADVRRIVGMVQHLKRAHGYEGDSASVTAREIAARSKS